MPKALVALASGKLLDLFNPDPDLIDGGEIADSLSRICRFGGRGNRFYSVAEHSVLMSDFLSDRSRVLQLEALLHDASEAYIGDIIGPLKNAMPAIRNVERGIQSVIAERFGIPSSPSRVVSELDKRMNTTEIMELIPAFDGRAYYPDYPPIPSIRFRWWDSRMAARQFKSLFRHLL